MRELHTPAEASQWLRSRVSGMLHTDSRKVRAGDGFIAWPGAATDGRQYVKAALAQGARACIVEREGVESYQFDDELVAAYVELKAASGPIAAAYFEEPSRQLDVLAVTGTNGKTSTAWWLAQALSGLKQAPVPCGLVGTLGIGRPPVAGAADGPPGGVVPSGLTTPDPVLLQQNLRRFVDEGLRACAIEASSIGIEEHRLDGTRIRTAIFINLTQDHLDYHGSMDDYWAAKTVLFQWPGLRAAVINVDDVRGLELAEVLLGTALDLWTFSCSGPARLQARDMAYDARGLRFTVLEGTEQHVLGTQLIGQYNASNLLAVIGAMRSLGIPLAAAVQACHELSPVPGRMEIVRLETVGVSAAGPSQGAKAPSGGSAAHAVASVGATIPLAAVDYAHTPDALDKALAALRPLADQRGGQLWCVFGCGGERDAVKRPLMGAVAARNADHVVLTSDNPRSEKPEAIISQILLGLAGHASVTVQADRALAIAQTLSQAAANDVVLIAGKGHEEFQEIAGRKLPFSDREQAQRALRVPRAGAPA